jgi:tetratricopeptide (TPR) repeat protein
MRRRKGLTRSPVVSKKHQHRTFAAPTPAELGARIEKASREGRYQQALELAKQLNKQEPNPAHYQLLLKTYLGRARQLRGQGYLRDALTVVSAAMSVGGDDPAWLAQVAEELAACGDTKRALETLKRVPDSQALPRILGQAADAAVRQESAGRNSLPAELQGDFDRVLTAFAQVTAGQDEAARETLQGIGLRSPFLEWKLLLRGLMAFYQQDDARALENWQRLTPERLPARLAAPLRFEIDRAYQGAQPPAVQATLRNQADRLESDGLVPHLRNIQQALAGGESLARAFRVAEPVFPLLRQQAPHLLPRLAQCFFWAIVNQGQPEDVLRYERHFGTPPEDPHLDRLRALALENLGGPEAAHESWQDFERSVAKNPGAWPGDQARLVRALVWYHMGQNAASIPTKEEARELGIPKSELPDLPPPLVPGPEKCFRRSLELAPEELETYEALFSYYQRRHQPSKAERAAEQLLEHFPSHGPTLTALGDLRMEQGNYARALDAFQRAVKADPLNRSLRWKISTAHSFKARAHAEAGQFEEARAEYQAALALRETNRNESAIYCKWAACEFKAANPERAEELLQQALGEAGNRLAVAYSMLIEVIRLKLPRTLKTRFDREFNASLAEAPTGAGAAAVADTAATHRLAGVTYTGQKTHEKKVLGYLEKAKKASFTEEQLERICLALLALEARKLLLAYAALGRKQFPDNPRFYLVEADLYLLDDRRRIRTWIVEDLLKQARACAERLPPDEKRKELLDAIQKRMNRLDELNPFARLFRMENPFDFLGPDEDDFDDEDDEFDDDDW